MATPILRSQRLPELLVLVLISAGFAASILAYRTFFPDSYGFLTSDEVLLGFFTCVATFWIAVKLTEYDTVKSPWMRLTSEFAIGTGINLIVQALLNYLDILTRSMFLIVVGGIFAASLLAIARRLIPARDENFQAGTVMVGFDRRSAELVPLLPYPLTGVVGEAPHPPAALAAHYDELAGILIRLEPRQVVVTPESAGRVEPPVLLAQRLKGTSVNSTPELYEQLLGRVCCSGPAPVDLLLSQAVSGNPQAMAVQAIYTNLIGLILLIAVSPAMAAAMLAMAFFSGPGPIIETEVCSGFRNIPFRRMRFRTRRMDGSGAYHPVGKLISRLHLTDLPLLINIIRGEMALFGPRPVRRVFAARLTQVIPFYSMRFAVKPGIIHWGGQQGGRAQGRASDLTEIEYDLYYAKHGSPLLDFQILTMLILGGKRREVSRVEFAPAAQ